MTALLSAPPIRISIKNDAAWKTNSKNGLLFGFHTDGKELVCLVMDQMGNFLLLEPKDFTADLRYEVGSDRWLDPFYKANGEEEPIF